MDHPSCMVRPYACFEHSIASTLPFVLCSASLPLIVQRPQDTVHRTPLPTPLHNHVYLSLRFTPHTPFSLQPSTFQPPHYQLPKHLCVSLLFPLLPLLPPRLHLLQRLDHPRITRHIRQRRFQVPLSLLVILARHSSKRTAVQCFTALSGGQIVDRQSPRS